MAELHQIRDDAEPGRAPHDRGRHRRRRLGVILLAGVALLLAVGRLTVFAPARVVEAAGTVAVVEGGDAPIAVIRAPEPADR